jgi:hypothetical protein
LGVLPYVICNAVKPDATVVSLHHNIYPEDFFEKLSLYCQYHLGCPAKYFNIANVYSSPNVGDDSKLDYLTIESSFILESIQQKMIYDYFTLFTALIEESATQTYSTLENELTDNIQNMK